MGKNCWKNCSPMETGLGLALIVSVTFLIIMVIVYLAGDSSVGTLLGTKHYECKRACRCIDDFSRLLFFPLNPDTRIMEDAELLNLLPFQQSEIYETVCLGKNYSMAAVVKQIYDDELTYFEYISPAAVLSSIWLISRNTFDSDATNFYAAIGSKYWSKSGYLHRVETIVPVEEILILLKLQMKIIIEMDFVELVGSLVVENVLITTWNEAYKHEKAVETRLSVLDSSFCIDATFCTVPSDSEVKMDSTLAVWNNRLYGFYNDTICGGITCAYRFASISPYISFIKSYLEQNTI